MSETQSYNWADLKDKAANAGFDNTPPPPGSYRVKVVFTESNPSSNGHDMIRMRAKIQEGPEKGKTLFNNFVLSLDSDVSIGYFLRNTHAHGLDDAFFASSPSFEKIADALKGTEAIWTCESGTYKGKPRANVKTVSAVPAGAATPAPPTLTPPTPPAANVPPPAPPAPVPPVSSTPAPSAPPF